MKPVRGAHKECPLNTYFFPGPPLKNYILYKHHTVIQNFLQDVHDIQVIRRETLSLSLKWPHF